jgi:hypothetical protein
MDSIVVDDLALAVVVAVSPVPVWFHPMLVRLAVVIRQQQHSLLQLCFDDDSLDQSTPNIAMMRRRIATISHLHNSKMKE